MERFCSAVKDAAKAQGSDQLRINHGEHKNTWERANLPSDKKTTPNLDHAAGVIHVCNSYLSIEKASGCRG
jgi:hypothetical protein